MMHTRDEGDLSVPVTIENNESRIVSRIFAPDSGVMYTARRARYPPPSLHTQLRLTRISRPLAKD